jgi:hypothetical protein
MRWEYWSSSDDAVFDRMTVVRPLATFSLQFFLFEFSCFFYQGVVRRVHAQ